ncbi:MAG: hypothetical protein EKK57_07265 [Proteobacteria bacterium]|nr:MAG: hypothetical protein EKK57_07265 [Pseudomonadota bacterium]
MTREDKIKYIRDNILSRQKFVDWLNHGQFLNYITGDLKHEKGLTQTECDQIINREIEEIFGSIL